MPNNEYENEPNQSRSEDIISSILDGTEYDEPARSRIEYLLIQLKEAIEGGGGGGGVTSYSPLTEKPKIDNHTLQAGNNTSSDLGLQTKIDADHKLSADNVDDTNTTNKFNVKSDWNATSGASSEILNKPNLGTASAKNVPVSGDAATGEVVLGSDTRLTDARNAKDVYNWAKQSTKPTYNYSEIQNTPTIPDELSDLTEDSTHRTVTDAEKGTWSGKQDALTFDGTYSSSTNKAATVSTVTNAINALDVTGETNIAASKTIKSWSETDGKVSVTTQDIAITGTQAVLTGYSEPSTASAVAATDTVNAAIGKVEKKADDNETNISLSLDANGQKNLFKTTLNHYTHNGVAFDKVNDYTIKLTTASAISAQASCIISDVTFPQNKYAIKVVADGITLANDNVFVNVVYDLVGGSSNQNQNITDVLVFRNSEIIIKGLYVYVRSGKQPNGTIQVMVCPTALYDISDKMQPHALPNTELTALEQQNETNISLIADQTTQYNLADCSLAKLKTYSEYNVATPVWNGNVLSNNNKTFTVNGDGTITVTGTTGTNTARMTVYEGDISAGSFIKGCPSGGALSGGYLMAVYNSSGQSQAIDIGNGAVVNSDLTDAYIQIAVPATVAIDSKVFKLMLIPKSAYDAGFTDYQPYAMSNAELTAKEQTNENNISSIAAATAFVRKRTTVSASSRTISYTMSKDDFRTGTNDSGVYIITVVPWGTTAPVTMYTIAYSGGYLSYRTATKICGSDITFTFSGDTFEFDTSGLVTIYAMQ